MEETASARSLAKWHTMPAHREGGDERNHRHATSGRRWPSGPCRGPALAATSAQSISERRQPCLHLTPRTESPARSNAGRADGGAASTCGTAGARIATRTARTSEPGIKSASTAASNAMSRSVAASSANSDGSAASGWVHHGTALRTSRHRNTGSRTGSPVEQPHSSSGHRSRRSTRS